MVEGSAECANFLQPPSRRSRGTFLEVAAELYCSVPVNDDFNILEQVRSHSFKAFRHC